MSLFGRKKTEEKAPACNGGCPVGEAAEIEAARDCRGKAADGACHIEVLGSGCKSCHALLEAAKEAVKSMGLGAEVEFVTDMQRIMEYGVMRLPALVVNAQVVSMGRVLKAGDVERLLREIGF